MLPVTSFCRLGRHAALNLPQTRSYANRVSHKMRARMARTKTKNKQNEQPNVRDKDGGRHFMFRPIKVDSLSQAVFAERAPESNLPAFLPDKTSMLSIGQAMAFRQPPGTFQAYGLPKNMVLEFRLLPQPCSVVREVTLKTMNTLDIAAKKNSTDSRIVLAGPPGCGKSFLLVQAVNYAINAGWIVLYIPRAITFLDSSTKYQYDIRTRTFQQHSASQQLLSRFASVNNEALKTMEISLPIGVERLKRYTTGTPLLQFIQAGVRDPNLAPDILSTLLEQLGAQTERPVLLAVDDFQALYCTSEYRDPDFNLIQSHHLSIPRLLLEYAGGLKSFANGAVLGAVSSTNTKYLLPLELQEALGLPHDRHAGLYAKRSPALYPYLKGLRLFEVPPQLSVSEAKAIFELWSGNLALHTRPNDEFFLSKYTESSGNARCFVWKGLLATLES